jgi:hypothetical protein
MGQIVMKMLKLSVILLLLSSGMCAKAAELKPETLRAWDDYIGSVTLGGAERNAGSRSFLSLDESSEASRRVAKGELVITNHDPRKVPQGLIHDWIGVMFVPNSSLDQAMKVLDSYDRYSDIFHSLIRKTSVMERSQDAAKIEVLAVQKAFSVTAAVETDEEIQIVRLAPNKVCIRGSSTRIQEIANYGQPSEHVFPDARRPGYVWRALIIERLEQRDGGVYVELETISLSRGIPVEVRWLIKPLTDELPRRLMADILDATRVEMLRSAPAQ